MVSAGRTSASLVAKVMQSSRWWCWRVVQHINSDFVGFSLKLVRCHSLLKFVRYPASPSVSVQQFVISHRRNVVYCPRSSGDGGQVPLWSSPHWLYTAQKGEGQAPILVNNAVMSPPLHRIVGSSPARWTDYEHPFIQESSQLSTLSLIPNKHDSCWIKMLWSTMSNAADI